MERRGSGLKKIIDAYTIQEKYENNIIKVKEEQKVVYSQNLKAS